MLKDLASKNPGHAWIDGCLDEDQTILTLLLEILGWTVSKAPPNWERPIEKPAIFFFGIGFLQNLEDLLNDFEEVALVLVTNPDNTNPLKNLSYGRFHFLPSPIQPAQVEVILQLLI